MSFAGVFSSGRFALLAAAAFLAVGAAHAQISAPASTPADSKAAAVSSSDPSSSSSSFSSSSFFDTSSDAADPSAPEPAGGAAGQYDNKAGGGGHGWKGRLAFEAGGGANAPTSDSKPYITWGGNLTVGGGLHFSRGISLLAEYQFMDD